MPKSPDSAVILLMLDEDGCFVRWSRAAEQLTGYSNAEMVGQYFWETLFFPDDIEAVRHEFNRIVSGSALYESLECRWKTRSGSSRWMAFSNFERCLASDGSSGLVMTAVDNSVYRADTDWKDSLISEFVRTREAERHAISQFIHDTVAQSLVALCFSLEGWRQAAGESEADIAREIADRCCRQIRLLTRLVAPPEIAEGGFSEAIECHTRALRDADAIDIDFRSEVPPDSLSAEAGAALFLAIHELTAASIANRANHQMPIVLKRDGSSLLLEITGTFAASGAFCAPVRELASAFGGRFEIMRDSVRVALPISARAA